MDMPRAAPSVCAPERKKPVLCWPRPRLAGQLHLMGQMSTLAHEDGFVVSLTPCESYLDVSTSAFDLVLTHAYTEWPYFPYHGLRTGRAPRPPDSRAFSRRLAPTVARPMSLCGSSCGFTLWMPSPCTGHNAYALLVALYGDAFDLVTVQLYESWSHADYQIGVLKMAVPAYLSWWVRAITTGWWVDFAAVPELAVAAQWVKVPLSKLVIGNANGPPPLPIVPSTTSA